MNNPFNVPEAMPATPQRFLQRFPPMPAFQYAEHPTNDNVSPIKEYFSDFAPTSPRTPCPIRNNRVLPPVDSFASPVAAQASAVAMLANPVVRQINVPDEIKPIPRGQEEVAVVTAAAGEGLRQLFGPDRNEPGKGLKEFKPRDILGTNWQFPNNGARGAEGAALNQRLAYKIKREDSPRGFITILFDRMAATYKDANTILAQYWHERIVNAATRQRIRQHLHVHRDITSPVAQAMVSRLTPAEQDAIEFLVVNHVPRYYRPHITLTEAVMELLQSLGQ